MTSGTQLSAAPVEKVFAGAYTVPTDSPEADGTFAWTSTTLVVVEAHGGGEIGLGYSYTSKTVANLIEHTLAECVHGRDAMDPPAAWRAMTKSVRNMGREGARCHGDFRRGCGTLGPESKIA